ncbi:MAG: hypothetical protein WC889_07535 [Myxococcota bacterium]|jgi:hypothetical protein
MHYLVLGLVVVAAALLFLFAAPRTGSAQKPSTSSVPVTAQAGDKSPAPKTDTEKFQARQWLEQKLLKLQNSSPKIEKDISAMCYKMVFDSTTKDYICPKDGERTQYPLRKSGRFLAIDIEPMRDMIKNFNAIYLLLDESEFCKKCSPNVKDPQLVLVVKIPGMPDHRIRGVTREDVILIKEFSEGKEVHKGSHDEETPLKDYLPRIEKLLGISVDKKAR